MRLLTRSPRLLELTCALASPLVLAAVAAAQTTSIGLSSVRS
jgi:hypothetical protein